MALTPAVSHNDHSLGDPGARLTLVEYGDYQCPYCGAAYEALKLVKAELGGDLRFVFRNFPLKNAHPNAEAALGGAFAARVDADFHGGLRSGVNGTPTFFINGRRHDGSYEASVLIAALRDVLGN